MTAQTTTPRSHADYLVNGDLRPIADYLALARGLGCAATESCRMPHLCSHFTGQCRCDGDSADLTDTAYLRELLNLSQTAFGFFSKLSGIATAS
jgi:hypothetical protein